MVTMIGLEKDVIDLLKDLATLDFDAIEAYQEAVDRLEKQSYRNRFTEFMKDHERHTREIASILRAMGEEAPEGPSAKRLLTKGKVVIADLMGDKAILMAMKTNEEDTNTAYERAAQHEGLDGKMRDVVERALTDERTHRDWIERTIEQLD